jgi:hypothetical protein
MGPRCVTYPYPYPYPSLGIVNRKRKSCGLRHHDRHAAGMPYRGPSDLQNVATWLTAAPLFPPVPY